MSVLPTLMSTKESCVFLFVTHFQFPEVLSTTEYQEKRKKKQVGVEHEPTLKVLSGAI